MSPVISSGSGLAKKRGSTPPTILSFLGQTSWSRPIADTPVQAYGLGWTMKPFNTKTGLDSIISALAPNQYAWYSGPGTLPTSADFAAGRFYSTSTPAPLVISSSSGNGYSITNKNLASPAIIDFGCSANQWDSTKITANHVEFKYTGTSSFAGILINSCSNLYIFGGDYSGGTSGGSGFNMMGNTNHCYFMDLYAHDCGTGGLSSIPKDAFTGALTTHDNNTWRGEVYNWGTDPAADSHVQAPGTGLHGFMAADAGGTWTNNKVAVWGHDPTTVGCVFEIGSQVSKGSGLLANNTIYAKGEHLHFHSTQSCANVVNLWGDKDLSTNTFAWIEGNDIYGAVIRSSGSSSITQGMPVTHGRHSQTNLNPSDGLTVPYEQGIGIAYSSDVL